MTVGDPQDTSDWRAEDIKSLTSGLKRCSTEPLARSQEKNCQEKVYFRKWIETPKISKTQRVQKIKIKNCLRHGVFALSICSPGILKHQEVRKKIEKFLQKTGEFYNRTIVGDRLAPRTHPNCLNTKKHPSQVTLELHVLENICYGS